VPKWLCHAISPIRRLAGGVQFTLSPTPNIANSAGRFITFNAIDLPAPRSYPTIQVH
jgi:hypothetical protein